LVSFWSVLAGLVAAAAVSAWQPSAGYVRNRTLSSTMPALGPRHRPRWVGTVGAALAVLLVVDGPVGGVVAAAVAYLVHHRSRAATTAPHRSAAARRALELPIAVEVLASCLTIGATQEQALEAVAQGLGGSLADDFSRTAGALRVGADVAEAWSLVPSTDLRSLASVLSRAHVTGAPVAPQLWMLADQHRQVARLVAMDAARTLGVRSTGPLGLCFLPAFVLVAIVPLVLSLLSPEL
jgi:Flp pilus assembly protein TadB